VFFVVKKGLFQQAQDIEGRKTDAGRKVAGVDNFNDILKKL
jgi:hypothetical protein